MLTYLITIASHYVNVFASLIKLQIYKKKEEIRLAMKEVT